MGLFSILNIGTRGLAASQMGMNLVGHNIANADVEGYSRKRLNISADYVYNETYGQIGCGVDIINIERMRNTFLDQQIRNQNQEVGMYKEIDYTLKSIENILTEPSDTGLMHFIDQFFDSWENLCSNPADTAARTMVRTNGEILSNIFRSLSTELHDLGETRNDEIKGRVENINLLLEEISNLNNEVAKVEISNQNANDSRDRRDLLLKKLSNLIDIDVNENNVGQITVTTGGHIIVSPNDISKLEITSVRVTKADGTEYTNIGIRFKGTNRTISPKKGELKGLFESRDVYIPAYEDWLDTLAVGIVEKVNAQHKLGYNLHGYTGINFFDPYVTGASDIEISASIISDLKNIAAALGESSQDAINIVTGANDLDFGNPPQQLSKTLGRLWVPGDSANERARNVVKGSVIVTDVSGATTLVKDVDYHIDHVSGTIQMLHNGYDGTSLSIDFKYNTGDFPGPGNNANAIEISKLRHELAMSPDALGNPTVTFDQYYSSGIGRLGLSKNEASSNLNTREFLVEQYEAHQDSISGVSLDEEMANMIKYQHTYQASARIISTVSEMLDILLNM